jgi:hypothetical protein
MWSTMIYLFGYGRAAGRRFFVWPLNVKGEIKKFNESQRIMEMLKGDPK